jgi:hypothetical protein
MLIRIQSLNKMRIWTRNPELLKLDLDPFADRISKRKAVLDQATLKIRSRLSPDPQPWFSCKF